MVLPDIVKGEFCRTNGGDGKGHLDKMASLGDSVPLLPMTGVLAFRFWELNMKSTLMCPRLVWDR